MVFLRCYVSLMKLILLAFLFFSFGSVSYSAVFHPIHLTVIDTDKQYLDIRSYLYVGMGDQYFCDAQILMNEQNYKIVGNVNGANQLLMALNPDPIVKQLGLTFNCAQEEYLSPGGNPSFSIVSYKLINDGTTYVDTVPNQSYVKIMP